MDKPQRRILRSPSVKRKSKVQPVHQRVTLERVLGLTVNNGAALACDSNSGTIAYPAGCVVVLFNPRRNKQSHIFNSSKKTITSIAFSGDGKHLVTGECGHQPAVRIWDVEEKTQVAEFHGHKFGINCVAFSPNLKYIVSVGTQHDMIVNVWNWRTGNKLASNKISSKVSSVAFSEDGSYFVTVGNRHVKFWYLQSSKSKINETVPLQGRNGLLGDMKNNFFCQVVCGQGITTGSTYIITQSGLLCEFNDKRLLDKWVELRATNANSVAVGDNHIFIGCANGIVRVFSALTLHFEATLPHPHSLGVDVASATDPNQVIFPKEDAKFPDTLAVVYDSDHKKLTCIYNDHSLYIWDMHNIKKIGKAWSFLFHSSCIWSLEKYPAFDHDNAPLPSASFITGSNDDTIRIWNLDPHMTDKPNCKRNIYSSELLKIIYTDPSYTFLCDVDYNPAGATDKTDTKYDGKNGIRSLRVSPDGRHLACGDHVGNVRIYDASFMDEITMIEAHEGDVLCLEYSHSELGPKILASASRDRLIHVYDVEQGYGILQTLADHSASVSSVRFTWFDNQLKMLSCGADKSLLFRNAVMSPDFQFTLDQHLVSKTTLYDMVVDPTMKFVATACNDRNVRIYNIRTAKQKKHYRGSVGDDGILWRLQLDPSGTYCVTSCTDKNMCIIDFYTGELVANMYGHSESITGIMFMNDLKHIISVSADGCVFIWRLPLDLTKNMKDRLEEMGKVPKEAQFINDLRKETTIIPNPVMLDHMNHIQDEFPVNQFQPPAEVLNILEKEKREVEIPKEANMNFRFSVGQLPNWAKAKIGDGSTDSSESKDEAVQPRGRWAQRAEQGNVKSQLDMKQFDAEQDLRRFAFEANSLQSQLSELRRETVILSKQAGAPQGISVPVIDDDDEINVDDEDEFKPLFCADTKNLFETAPGRTSPATSRSDIKWNSRFGIRIDRLQSVEDTESDDLDLRSDSPEVIYYPPSEVDSVESYSTSYQVFNLPQNELTTTQRANLKKYQETNLDDDSESTEPVSLEDEDENEDTLGSSVPGTPSDSDKELLARTPDKEKFVKDMFETPTFSPVPMDKFNMDMEEAEKEKVMTSSPFASRLSISSRFLSRAQQMNIRNMSVYGSVQRQDHWFNMGWHSDSDREQPNEDPPSPPTKLDVTKSLFSQPEDKLTIPKPSVSLTDISWDQDKTSSEDQLHSAYNLRHSESAGKLDLKPTRDGSKQASYMRPTNSSKAKISRSSSSSSLPLSDHSAGGGSNNSDSVSKSSSLSNLNPVKEYRAEPKSGSPVRKHGKKRLSAAKIALYASTPNLAACNEEEEEEVEKPTNLMSLADLSRSVPDINDLNDCTSSSTEGSSDDKRQMDSVYRKNRDSSGSRRPSAERRKASRQSEPFVKPLDYGQRKNSLNKLSQQKNFVSLTKPSNKIVNALSGKCDTKLMPPPSNVGRLKRDSLMKSAAQAKRRSTTELTLSQAKDILMGRSGILRKASLGSSQSSGSNGPSRNCSDVTVVPETPSPVDSRGSSTSSDVFNPDHQYPGAGMLAMAEAIDQTATELRNSRSLEASPSDLPERDHPVKRPANSCAKKHLCDSETDPGLTDRRRSNTAEDMDSTVTSKQDGDSDYHLPSVRARVAQYMSLSKSVEDLTETPASPAAVRLNTKSPRSDTGSPTPSTHRQGNVKVSPRSQSDTGLGSEVDTDSEIKRSSESPSHPRQSLVNGHHNTKNSLPNERALPSVADRTSLSLPLNQTENLQSCYVLVDDLDEIVLRSKELYRKVCDENSKDMIKMLENAFTSTHEAFSNMASSVPPLSSSQTSKVEDEKVVAKALEMFEPILTQFANSLSDKVLDMSDQVTDMIHEKLNQSSVPSHTVPSDL
ncbi:mitogen-activated protein kinase-binding protein 1-like isoform X2 [Gigantopelta aegis]|uniref:mitogen-activated protein kinase-binding protein 1-like isoform X2 n=1 Tax=Gigantopelta aegis TaxID=1735272 RepID=UPI001B88D149|nr:mitogen-activated protein kinase-binding protein 1-like isoform X2 [Gigantopelta aegis]